MVRSFKESIEKSIHSAEKRIQQKATELGCYLIGPRSSISRSLLHSSSIEVLGMTSDEVPGGPGRVRNSSAAGISFKIQRGSDQRRLKRVTGFQSCWSLDLIAGFKFGHPHKGSTQEITHPHGFKLQGPHHEIMYRTRKFA